MKQTKREDLLGSVQDQLTYAGELSFLRRKRTREISGADIVVSGIPFDLATTFRPGARFGPQAIRAASVQLAELTERAFPFGINPFDVLAVADWGDCELIPGHPELASDAIEAHARHLLSEDVMMVTLGGDHFVTYPLLRAHAKKHGPLSLIHFDAHVDTWDDDGERLDHGSMFLRAQREGIVDSSDNREFAAVVRIVGNDEQRPGSQIGRDEIVQPTGIPSGEGGERLRI